MSEVWRRAVKVVGGGALEIRRGTTASDVEQFLGGYYEVEELEGWDTLRFYVTSLAGESYALATDDWLMFDGGKLKLMGATQFAELYEIRN